MATGKSDSQHSPAIAIFALIFAILIIPWSPVGSSALWGVLQPFLLVALVYLVVKWLVRREVQRELGRRARQT